MGWETELQCIIAGMVEGALISPRNSASEGVECGGKNMSRI